MKNSLIRSCTDFRFYKEIFQQPIGKTLRYLLSLVILVTIILGVRYGIGFYRFSKEILKWVEEKAPVVEITDGVVAAEVNQPYLVEGEDFVMIVDTTGQTTRIEEKYKAGILLTKDKLMIKHDEVRTQEFDLSKIKSFKLNKNTFSKWRKIFIYVLMPFMLVMQFFYFTIAKVVQVLLTGLVALIFKPAVKYSNILNICVYALTPVTILSLVVTLVSPKVIPFFWLIYLGMYIAFIIGALKQCSLEPVAE